MICSYLRDAALWYARAGWAVLPIEPGAKAPVLIRSGEGHARASTDPRQVALWWDRRWDANVAVATGPSGLLVADLDGRAGVAAWRALVPPGCDRWPRTSAVRTPRGGLHIYFGCNHDAKPLGNTAGQLAEHIDTRGAGGYVLAPPSVVRGHRYRWANYGPEGLPPVLPLPGWLVERLRPPECGTVPCRPGPKVPDRYLAAAIKSAAERVRWASQGTRNATLSTEVYSLGRLARSDEDAEAITEAMTLAALDAGLPPHEVAATIRSAFNGRARQGQP